MKLSIVIPVYNNAEHLAQCLGSIGEHDGVEVVVVDDGSDVPVRLPRGTHARLVRQMNGGAYAARRRGTEEANGEYVWYVDADDEVLCIPEIPDADVVRFRQEYGWMCIGDKVYRRGVALAAFNELGDLRMRHCEDGLFYLAANKNAAKVVDVDKAVYKYINCPGSATHRFNPDVVQERERYVDEHVRLCPDADRAVLSKESAEFVVVSLCRWPASMSQIRKVCARLVSSRLVADGAEAIKADPYVRKMMFAARHPFVIWLYRALKHR